MKRNKYFGKSFENINYKSIKSLINNLKNNLPNLKIEPGEELTTLDDSLIVFKSHTMHSLKKISSIRYPIYNNGSFKEDIYNFLKRSGNSDISKLFNEIETEINKVYKSYITFENLLYDKIVSIINFCENRRNLSNLQIVSRIKEIYEILRNSYYFIFHYLFHNFDLLKKIFKLMDDTLARKYYTKSLSLIFLLKFFELPNNELSYMLMFKIFDEETLVFSNILNKLEKQIKSNNNLIEGSLINLIDNNIERNVNGKDANFLNEQNSEEQNETISAIVDIMGDYKEKSNHICKMINNIFSYRVLYNNYYIFLRGNYNIYINNRFLFNSTVSIEEGNSANSSDKSDLISINSLMDEELIIQNFLNKKIIYEFVDYFKKLLPRKYKINKFLIIIHIFQYHSIFPIILFSYNDTNNNEYIQMACLFLICYYIGIFFSRIINTCLSIKKVSLKTILISSNLLLIISLSFPFFIKYFFEDLKLQYFVIFVMISRFLIGLSFSESIESNFLINYEPKILVIKSVKFFYSMKYLAMFFAILYVSLIEKFVPDFSFSCKKINKLLNINKHELFFFAISFVIMIINLIFFRNLKNKEIINNNDNEKLLLKKSDNSELVKRSNIFESTSSDLSRSASEEVKSVLSYGKSKIISYNNRRKAKSLDKKYKLFSDEKYEGTNDIFESLEEIINKQKNCCSYINKISFILVLLLISSIINNEILIFSLPLKLKKEKVTIFIFSFPYLLSFLSFKYRKIFWNKSDDRISFLNTIILIFLVLELIFFTLIILAIKYEQDDFIFYIFSIATSFFNVIIEILITYSMNIVIPIEKKILSIGLGRFADTCVILFKIINFLFIYFSPFSKDNAENDSNFIQNILFLFIIRIFVCIIEIIYLIFFNYKMNYNSLTRIMNKITYEK